MLDRVKRTALAAAAACAAAVLVMGGCAGGAQEQNRFDPYDLSQGVAVTVNGTEIGEGAVTAYLENFRAVNDLETDDAWGEWLMNNGYGVEGIRDETLNLFVSQELVRQAAEARGIEVTEDEVDEAVAALRESAGSDEEWEKALEDMGMNEAEYRASAELSLIQGKLADDIGADVTAADDELMAYIRMTYEDYAEAESLDEVDEAVASEARAAMDYYAKQRAFSDFMMAFEEDSDIQKNGLPEDASYWIDLVPYEEAYYAEQNGQAPAADDGAESDAASADGGEDDGE